MLISTTYLRFRVPYENVELFKHLTEVRMISVIQLRFFLFLLQLVHLRNFKRRTCILKVEKKKKKKMLQTTWWREKDKSVACVAKIQHKKIMCLKNAC